MTYAVNSNTGRGGSATVGSLLRGNDNPAEVPRLERIMILCHASGMNRAALLAHPEHILEAAIAERYRLLCARRAAGEPVAYLVGNREFFGLPLTLTPAVLIPRPETELLVEAALARVPEHTKVRVLDLGTGSGAVAIAMAKHRPLAEVLAVDISPDALRVAEANASSNGVPNIRFIESDWYSALDDGRFDVIVGNPPYIADDDPHLGQGDLRFEPRVALSSGPDGLDAIRHIVSGAIGRLIPGGWLLLEHGFDQAARCRALVTAAGLTGVATMPDLNGLDRVTFGSGG